MCCCTRFFEKAGSGLYQSSPDFSRANLSISALLCSRQAQYRSYSREDLKICKGEWFMEIADQREYSLKKVDSFGKIRHLKYTNKKGERETNEKG